MLEVPVYNQAGEVIEKISVDPATLGANDEGQPRKALLKQAIVYYNAAKRQGTHRSKRRGEVEGSTRKIYKQKGTGNARQGSIRQPVRVGGGHAKQRLPKEWRLGLNVKARRLARDNALLVKVMDGSLKLVDKVEIKEAKTKLMAGVFKNLKLGSSVLLALDTESPILYRAARNIDRTYVSTVAQLNAWDILARRNVVMTKAGFSTFLKEKA
jgi:large subunit ribosomal protein L4